MKRIFIFLLALFVCIAPLCASAETGTPLPSGTWEQFGGALFFALSSDITLDVESAVAFGLTWPDVLEGATLRKGTLLSEEQFLWLWPQLPVGLALSSEPGASVESEGKTPVLTKFKLTGEWYYNDAGVLCYDAGEGYRTLTVDEVFAALDGSSAQRAENQKKVYFTFDDAPSKYTMELLSALDALDVKATFFVVGAYVKAHPVFLRAIYDFGHVIGNHSYSHNQSTLQESTASCIADFKKCQNRVNEALGFEYPMTVARVPYGSSTLSAQSKRALESLGYLWIDWNALNGDAEAGIDTYDEAYEYAIDTASHCSGDVVLLMHDGKQKTINMLPDLVQYFRENGYEFAVVTTDITEKIDGVRMGFPAQ